MDNKCILYTNKILRVLNACLGILYNFVIKLDIIQYYIEEKCETRFSLLYSIYVILIICLILWVWWKNIIGNCMRPDFVQNVCSIFVASGILFNWLFKKSLRV